MIKYYDPLKDIIKAVKNLYGNINVIIQYDPRIKKFLFWGSCGYTFFPDDKSTPIIVLNPNIPFIHIVETLAHELAHVVTPDHEHDNVWEEAFSKIQKEYIRMNE